MKGSMDSSCTTVIDYGVDYITVTATAQPFVTSLLAVAKQNLSDEVRAGSEAKEWRGLGYQGVYAGSVSYGVGPQGVLARLSSGVARERWEEVYASGMKCTRLDLQVTVRQACSATEVVQRDWESVCGFWSKHPTLKKPELRSGPYGPESIEIGSRQSGRCGRIYDKGVESKLDYYQNAVRYEVEFKGKPASILASRLCRDPRALAPVSTHVSMFFRKHQVALSLPTCSHAHFSVPAEERSSVRKLRYLRKSVSPMIRFLVSRGALDEVLEALELTAFVEVRSR